MLRSTKLVRLAATALLAAGIAACDGDGPIGPQLAAPSGLQARATAAGVELAWSASAGAESYTVERDVVGDAAGYTAVAQGVTATTYADADAKAPGAVYQYRVKAVRGTEVAISEEVEVTVPREPVVALGSIGNTTRRLSADTTYVITGLVYVDSGGVLEIPAGTVLKGDTIARPSALIVRVGGKILASGTAEKPIVFTSMRGPGKRRRGDWGGIVINGRSHCNFPAPCTGEAGSGQYGGTRAEDNSGVLRYVRIEYAGFEVSPNNELNGLTLNGVGNGTKIEYVQVHMGSDDGIEFFGGTVDVKYALVTGASDDSFDYSTGWQGRGQFWIVQQDPAEGDRGFEVDGNENNYTAQPFTEPTIYNVTLVGKGTQGSANASPAAFQLRRGTKGKIHNAIVLGWKTAIDIDDAVTAASCVDGSLRMANGIFHGNTSMLDGDSDTHEQTCTGTTFWNDLRQADPALVAPYDRSAPDFRPSSGSPALSGAATPPNDGFFSPVDYVGAVAPSGTPWYQGWTTTATS